MKHNNYVDMSMIRSLKYSLKVQRLLWCTCPGLIKNGKELVAI